MRRLRLVILLLLCAGLLFAQEGLYAPAVPEDAALVRVVNATDDPLEIDLGSVRYEVGARSSSAYRPLQPGVFVIAHAGERTVVEPTAKAFLSVVVSSSGVDVFPDERHSDPARAQLVIYNVGTARVDFRSESPEAVLVPDVAPGESGVRVVNAVRVTVAAFAGEETLAGAELDLERGESYALVVTSPESGVRGFTVRAAVASE
ncbi:MAG: alginate O-acetyltransferase AlgF [Spirochaetota bacterium]